MQAGERVNKISGSANTPWTDVELRQSVNTYVLLLRMQVQGMDSNLERVAQALLSGPLTLRNDAAIRYRLRNISAVVNDLGGPTLTDFSPAESVGSKVRPRIRAMLLEHADFRRVLSPDLAAPRQERQEALAALAVLRQRIEDLEQDLFWIGHNNPPDELGASNLDREEMGQALSSVNSISAELEKSEPDTATISGAMSQLVRFGTILAKWIGERTTKFVDAALLSAAPIAVAKASGILPALVSAIESVGRAAGH